MTSQEQPHRTDYRTITIKTSDGSTVQGRVNISPHQRVSEIFTLQKGPFVVVVDASYGTVSGKTLFINKEHIVWVEPEDRPE
ncbi:MAG: hypothetical protein HY911_14350 [Desulfobacterales bacterium]|nr:hypothetical protein [Desulfobacterales bacterium]